MLFKISYNPEDVIDRGDGYVLLNIKRYGHWTAAASLFTIPGSSLEDATRIAKSAKTVFIGNKGGIHF